MSRPMIVNKELYRTLPWNDPPIRPVLKWAGGKSQLLQEIRKHYPAELGRRIKKYAEPFVGGGAVLFDILSNYSLESVYISDMNRELIETYTIIRDDIDNLVNKLAKYQKEYLKLNEEDRKEYYNAKRCRFNTVKKWKKITTELGALFIFLNRTGYNGLYRVNTRGGFNAPKGSYKNPCILDEDNLRAVSQALSNVDIRRADYEESSSFIDDRTFVYFDPPYRPLTGTANFTAYTEFPFDDEAQKKLATYIHQLAGRGVKVLASNSDPKNVDKNDDFFDNLYKGLNIRRVKATRRISSKASTRGEITELLIYN
ncbi:MAG: DNA adenine methylase [Thermoguttaceae bacterium]|nr:DNA adenine methylase [Thermoguttaceae bacterium]